MKQLDLSIIKEKINVIKGAELSQIGRAGNMAWLSLNVSGKAYALHIQSGFRFRDKIEILFANLDMFEPTEELASKEDFDWDTYDWDVQGFNRYDQQAARFKEKYGKGLKVKRVSVNDFGDLTIEFENDIFLEVFLNASSGEECWRFFERHANSHLVVSSKGIML